VQIVNAKESVQNCRRGRWCILAYGGAGSEREMIRRVDRVGLVHELLIQPIHCHLSTHKGTVLSIHVAQILSTCRPTLLHIEFSTRAGGCRSFSVCRHCALVSTSHDQIANNQMSRKGVGFSAFRGLTQHPERVRAQSRDAMRCHAMPCSIYGSHTIISE
jgi:hypothetical protein